MPVSAAASASSTLVLVGPGLVVAVVLLTGLATVVVAATQLLPGRQIAVAALRAGVQLAAVSTVIAAIVASGWLSAAFVLVMFAVASWTAGRRITPHRSSWWAALPLAVSVVPVVSALLLSGLVPPRGLAAIPVAGILLGGAMTATALAGRRAADELWSRRGEVEAALALGLTPRDARLLVCRPVAASALVPGLDQTRTVGLVTLPGAFVGMLLGGASPVEAGAVQLLVLTGLLAVQAIAVAGTVELLAGGLVQLPVAGRPPRPTRTAGLARLRGQVARGRGEPG